MKAIQEFTKAENTFATKYLSVREKEGFLIPDKLVQDLPDISQSHPLFEQWKLRKINSQKFCDFLTERNPKGYILELGCGNGWFAHQIAMSCEAQVVGLDINMPELEQANRVFHRENLVFGFGDIFKANFSMKFDVIVLNAAVQYFSNFQLLLKRLEACLSPNGEIHILDSHFYESKLALADAKKRSEEYYENIGVPEMKNHYFHHSMDDLKDFEIMSRVRGKLSSLFRKKSPFAWYRKSLRK